MDEHAELQRVEGLVTARWDAEAVLLRDGGQSEKYVMADAPWPPSRMPPIGQRVELVFDAGGLVCDWRPADGE
jgi:hypothetical protein